MPYLLNTSSSPASANYIEGDGKNQAYSLRHASLPLQAEQPQSMPSGKSIPQKTMTQRSQSLYATPLYYEEILWRCLRLHLLTAFGCCLQKPLYCSGIPLPHPAFSSRFIIPFGSSNLERGLDSIVSQYASMHLYILIRVRSSAVFFEFCRYLTYCVDSGFALVYCQSCKHIYHLFHCLAFFKGYND